MYISISDATESFWDSRVLLLSLFWTVRNASQGAAYIGCILDFRTEPLVHKCARDEREKADEEHTIYSSGARKSDGIQSGLLHSVIAGRWQGPDAIQGKLIY